MKQYLIGKLLLAGGILAWINNPVLGQGIPSCYVTGKSPAGIFSSPWIWVAGGVFIIILLILILRGGSNKE